MIAGTPCLLSAVNFIMNRNLVLQVRVTQRNNCSGSWKFLKCFITKGKDMSDELRTANLHYQLKVTGTNMLNCFNKHVFKQRQTSTSNVNQLASDSLAACLCCLFAQQHTKLCAFFRIIPRRLNFICRRFGTLCLLHLHRQVGVERLS